MTLTAAYDVFDYDKTPASPPKACVFIGRTKLFKNINVIEILKSVFQLNIEYPIYEILEPKKGNMFFQFLPDQLYWKPV